MDELTNLRRERDIRRAIYCEVAAMVQRWAEETPDHLAVEKYVLCRAAYDIKGEVDGHAPIGR